MSKRDTHLNGAVGGGGREKTKIKAQVISIPVLGNDINDEKISFFFCILYQRP